MTESVLTRNQKKQYGPVFYKEYGTEFKITAQVRYDDECKNGHNSFSITGDIRRKGQNGHWYEDSCGMLHDEISKRFPELKKYLKWHLVSSDGPMHYVANTRYHASNRDCWGKLKGEPKDFKTMIKFKGFPFTFEKLNRNLVLWLQENPGASTGVIIEHAHKKDASYSYAPKYSFQALDEDAETIRRIGQMEWYKCPFDSLREAEEFKQALETLEIEFITYPTSWGEGKEREFDHARSTAIWPEATDEQLSLPPAELEKALMERLPALLKEFKADIEELGFIY